MSERTQQAAGAVTMAVVAGVSVVVIPTVGLPAAVGAVVFGLASVTLLGNCLLPATTARGRERRPER